MSKLTREQKIEIYKKRKQEESLASLSREYSILKANVQYLVNLINKHGEGILRNIQKYYQALEAKQASCVMA